MKINLTCTTMLRKHTNNTALNMPRAELEHRALLNN